MYIHLYYSRQINKGSHVKLKVGNSVFFNIALNSFPRHRLKLGQNDNALLYKKRPNILKVV